MPQLDKFTFSTQVIWLICIFFLLYFLLVCFSLPTLYRILLFRTKKIVFLESGGSLLYAEGFAFKLLSKQYLSKSLVLYSKLPTNLSKIVDLALLCHESTFLNLQGYNLPNFHSYRV